MPLDLTINALRTQLCECAQSAGRSPNSVRLIAVSKMQDAARIRAAFACGQSVFGENYLQEALDKQTSLADLAIEWHFIGHIQGRKARDVGHYFQWAHTIDRAEILPKLNQGALMAGRKLNVCLQVRVSNEDSKSGCAPTELSALAHRVIEQPQLILRGLMAIPAPVPTTLPSDERLRLQKKPFALMRQWLEELKREEGLRHHPWDTLSMGMSDDYPAAIAEGATLVRIGTAIFGARPAKD